jgi:hypothetical protein
MDGTRSWGSGWRGEVAESDGRNGFTNGETEQRRTNRVLWLVRFSVRLRISRSSGPRRHEDTKTRKREDTKTRRKETQSRNHETTKPRNHEEDSGQRPHRAERAETKVNADRVDARRAAAPVAGIGRGRESLGIECDSCPRPIPATRLACFAGQRVDPRRSVRPPFPLLLVCERDSVSAPVRAHESWPKFDYHPQRCLFCSKPTPSRNHSLACAR